MPAVISSDYWSSGAARRFAIYLALWCVLIGFGWSDFTVGLTTAAAATWVSLALLPLGDRRVSLAAAARLAARMPWQSLVAGVDVARRALDPRLPLQPGLIRYPSGLAAGPQRNAFRALMSLQPGTLPISVNETGEMLIHCLDTGQPIAAGLAAEEALFAHLTTGGPGGARQHG